MAGVEFHFKRDHTESQLSVQAFARIQMERSTSPKGRFCSRPIRWLSANEERHRLISPLLLRTSRKNPPYPPIVVVVVVEMAGHSRSISGKNRSSDALSLCSFRDIWLEKGSRFLEASPDLAWFKAFLSKSSSPPGRRGISLVWHDFLALDHREEKTGIFSSPWSLIFPLRFGQKVWNFGMKITGCFYPQRLKRRFDRRSTSHESITIFGRKEFRPQRGKFETVRLWVSRNNKGT